MTREAVDTNVLLRAAVDLGDEQTKTARALLLASGRVFSVSLVALAEATYVLVHHYGMTRAHSAATMRWLLGLDSLDCSRQLVLNALDDFENHPQLAFEDCLMAEEAQAKDATPLWTFDVKLARQHPVAKLLSA